ncbi:MAG TPA: hypothetical protein VNB90_03630 [Cytophagaceae bacterium]|nr:hypothetical protein [Cytophagaceae bacterium]
MTNLDLLQEEKKNPNPLPVDLDTQVLEKNIKILKRLSLEIINQNPLLAQDPVLEKAVNQLMQISTLEKLMVIAKELAQEIENQPSAQSHAPALEKLLMIAKDLTVEKLSQNEEIEKLQKNIKKGQSKKEISPEKILKTPKVKPTTVKVKLPKDIKDDQQLLLAF